MVLLDTAKIKVVLVCYSSDYFEYFKYLCESNEINKFKGQFLLDTSNRFALKNPFFLEEIVNKTVFTNAENEVLLVGNPLYNEILLNSFLKKTMQKK